MRFELRSATDTATHVIFDPAAVSHLTRDAYDTWFQTIGAEADRGNLIAYSYGGDGEMDFVVFVDEPVEPRLSERAGTVATGVLRVPSGRLLAGGLEHLGTPDRCTRQIIAPGNYEVTAYDLEWGEQAEDEADLAEERANPARARVLRWLGPLTGVLVLVTLLALIFAIGVWNMATRAESFELVLRFGPWLIVPWIAVLVLWKRLPDGSRPDRARAEVYRKYPGAVVHLRRLDGSEPIDTRKGCQFGIGLS
jgi:hypothetical protein